MDTGCEITMVPRRLVQGHRLQITPTDRQIWASATEGELARAISSITQPVLAKIDILEGDISEGELSVSSKALPEAGGQTSKPPPARTTVDDVIDAVAAGLDVVGTKPGDIVPGTSAATGSTAFVPKVSAGTRPRTNRTHACGLACTHPGCSGVFSRFDNLRRHTVRYHDELPDGTPAPPGMGRKLSDQVQASDARRRKGYIDTLPSSAVDC